MVLSLNANISLRGSRIICGESIDRENRRIFPIPASSFKYKHELVTKGILKIQSEYVILSQIKTGL
jgi:hypothetical protein